MTQLLRIREDKEEVADQGKRKHRPSWFIALVVLGLIPVLAVITIVYSVFLRPGDPVPQTVSTAQFVDTAAPETGDLTKIVPADTAWVLNGTTAVPTSKQAGPVSTKGIASGFARTPAGALFFLSWFSAQTWNPAVDKTTLVSHGVVNTTGYEGLLRAYVSSPVDPDVAGSVVYQLTAYRLLAYTPDSASFVLVQRSTSAASPGVLLAVTYTLRWDGDWKLVPPPDGQYFPVLQLQGLSSQFKPFQGA